MTKVATIEAEGLQATLAAMSSTERRGALYDALKEGAKTLQQETKANLLRKAGSIATKVSFVRKGRDKPMVDGVRLSRDNAYCQVTVTIMGDFRLKWFEKGTAERFTKDGVYRGAIKPLRFFAEARANEGALTAAINSRLENRIEKLLKHSVKYG